MSRTTRLAAIAVVLAAATSGLVQTAASASATATPDRLAGPAYSGREVFKIVARVPGPRHATARAWGAFSATGHFIKKNSTLVFPKGKIIVRRHVNKTTYSGPSLRTCRFKIVQRGTFAVRKATGEYRGLHESGHFTSRLFGRLKKTGTNRCGSTIVAKRTVTYMIGKAS